MIESVKTFSSKTLAIHYHIEATISNGNIYYPFYYGRWIDSLAGYFKQIILITHTSFTKTGQANRHRLKSRNVTLIDLGAKPSSLLKRVLRFKYYQHLVKTARGNFDYVLYRVPTPLAIAIYCSLREKTSLFLIVGNMVEMTKISEIKAWKKIFLMVYWSFDHFLLSRIGNKGIVFANGPVHAEGFPRIDNQITLFTSSIWLREVSKKRRLEVHSPLRLLYVGRLAEEKGLVSLLLAMHILEKKMAVCLTIIGDGNESIVYKLRRLCNELELNNVNFWGQIPDFKEIELAMDDHDIYIIPSLWDGQPRSVWEAMSKGMPVICSRGVQSALKLFEHKKDVYFVDANAPEQIAKGVTQIVEDRALRKTLIQSSLRIAKERCLEQAARLLVEGLAMRLGQRL